ncbi:MAG: ribosome-associated protein [Acidimicrobiaceae bacterium]
MADPSDRWPVLAAQAAASKKAVDPVVLAVGDVLAITDSFVIASGTNTRQVRSIAEEIELQITEAGGPKPLRVEGLDDLHWVLVDYGEFVVHVFLQETREYYELERLWSDVPRIEWETVPTRT